VSGWCFGETAAGAWFTPKRRAEQVSQRSNLDLPNDLDFRFLGPQLPGMSSAGFKRREEKPVLMIRLSRRGARKQPIYRIVVIEKDRARDGRSIEVVGIYNPRTTPTTIDMKKDRVDFWVSKGAQMSETVAKLYKNAPAAVAPVA
jgi:small subunit ribosomal protein S16